MGVDRTGTPKMCNTYFLLICPFNAQLIFALITICFIATSMTYSSLRMLGGTSFTTVSPMSQHHLGRRQKRRIQFWLLTFSAFESSYECIVPMSCVFTHFSLLCKPEWVCLLCCFNSRTELNALGSS